MLTNQKFKLFKLLLFIFTTLDNSFPRCHHWDDWSTPARAVCPMGRYRTGRRSLMESTLYDRWLLSIINFFPHIVLNSNLEQILNWYRCIRGTNSNKICLSGQRLLRTIEIINADFISARLFYCVIIWLYEKFVSPQPLYIFCQMISHF